jgi:hypothetical protein
VIHGIPLAVVDACSLDDERRRLLRPDASVPAARGIARRLPRFFFEVPSWDAAERTILTRHFTLSEFIDVDLHEAPALRMYPRYVPCAVALLAAHLEVLRVELGASVHVSANGGYRSPAHGKSAPGSTHAWGTAANVYRIGDDFLDNREIIRRYSLLAAALLPGIYVKPDEDGRGWTDDHIHLDLGYVTAVPQEAAGEHS